ncbi:MAG: hypothetical protein HOD54_02170 [Candidatus Magasanikbacteria bacterium]|jgi:hypothetical protein|nr:hypothetical protein [Candidatus Magasanikbacteria bacterium]
MKNLIIAAIIALISLTTPTLLHAEEYAPMCTQTAAMRTYDPSLQYYSKEECDQFWFAWKITSKKDGKYLEISFPQGHTLYRADPSRKTMYHGPFLDIRPGSGFFIVVRKSDKKENQMDIAGKMLLSNWCSQVTPMTPNGVFSSNFHGGWRLHSVRGKVILRGQSGPIKYGRIETPDDHSEVGYVVTYVLEMDGCDLEVRHLGLNGISLRDCGYGSGRGNGFSADPTDQEGEDIITILK